MAFADPAGPRVCPHCRARTALLHCAHDGTATFSVDNANWTASSRLVAGTLIGGRYRILGRLGRGGMGMVYEAEHTGSGQRVAVKVLAAELDDDGLGPLFRFHREARIIAALTHPNTVRLYDFGQADSGALYMVMELLRGPTLKQFMAKRAADGRALSAAETVAIGAAVLRSLSEAHHAGLVHRDIKPENIILSASVDSEPAIKLLDFGVAWMGGSSLTGKAAMVGTPSYMSPEQCLAQPVDSRADLYAVGVVLFWCLAGRTPFQGEAAAQIRGHCDTPPPDVRTLARETVPDGLVAVIERALAKAPADRFASAAEMREALEACIGEPAKISVDWLDPANRAEFAVGLYSDAGLPAEPSDDGSDGSDEVDQWGRTALQHTPAAFPALAATQRHPRRPPPEVPAAAANLDPQAPTAAPAPAPAAGETEWPTRREPGADGAPRHRWPRWAMATAAVAAVGAWGWARAGHQANAQAASVDAAAANAKVAPPAILPALPGATAVNGAPNPPAAAVAPAATPTTAQPVAAVQPAPPPTPTASQPVPAPTNGHRKPAGAMPRTKSERPSPKTPSPKAAPEMEEIR